VKRSQKKNAHTKMFQNTTRFQKRSVTRRPFPSATMFHKSIATPIPYQNATRFPNNTAQRNIKKSVTRFQLKFQSRSKKAFVSGLIRDTVMMMIIVKKIWLYYVQKLFYLLFSLLVSCDKHCIKLKICNILCPWTLQRALLLQLFI